MPFSVKVIFASGAEAWLRHGSRPGYGPIVRFPSRKTADVNREMVAQGLDEGDTAVVVKSPARLEASR